MWGLVVHLGALGQVGDLRCPGLAADPRGREPDPAALAVHMVPDPPQSSPCWGQSVFLNRIRPKVVLQDRWCTWGTWPKSAVSYNGGALGRGVRAPPFWPCEGSGNMPS